MPPPNQVEATKPAGEATAAAPTYSATARTFHWLTVVLLAILVPVGFIMADRMESDIGGPLTEALYSTHKSLGFVVLLLTVARLGYRLARGAPPDEPTRTGWQRMVSHATHWLLYALLLGVPLAGWVAVSYYDARVLFGLVALPRITPVDQDVAQLVFEAHKAGAFLILALIALHLAGALRHHFLLKDGVLRRMLPARAK